MALNLGPRVHDLVHVLADGADHFHNLVGFLPPEAQVLAQLIEAYLDNAAAVQVKGSLVQPQTRAFAEKIEVFEESP